MHFTTTALKVGLLLAASRKVDAFWRMPCHGRTGLAQIDPLVSFGVTAEHQHAIHGGSAFSTTSGTTELLESECTSCAVTQDKSAYWSPALYFKDAATGKFKLVNQVGGMLAYYLLNPNSVTTPLKAFPAGFEMIAGDTYQRKFSWPVPDKPLSAWTGDLQSQAFLRQYSLGFNCLNYNLAAEGSLTRHFLPDKAYLDAHCADGVRFELFFPSCWDGVNLDGVNHDKKSHMAYPNLGQTGTCPPGFPVRTVRLFYETIWNTNQFKGVDGQFVLANGDTTGFGYHGDFIMGWDQNFLQSAVDKCTNLSGKIEDCALFDIKPEPEYSAPTCKLEKNGGLVGALFQEDSSSDPTLALSALPGNVKLLGGPEYAKGAEPASSQSSSSVVAPVLYPASKVVASSSTPAVAAAVFAAASEVISSSSSSSSSSPTSSSSTSSSSSSTSLSSSSSSTSSAAPTVAPPAYIQSMPISAPPPQPTPSAPSKSYFSTEYVTKGNEVIEVLWVEDLVTVTASETSTVVAYMKEKRERHLHKHRRGQHGA